MIRNNMAFAMLLAGFALGGCGEKEVGGGTAPVPEVEEPAAHPHTELVKHGGVIVEVGAHAAALEVLHDEKAGTVTVYAMDMDGNALTPDEPPVLNLTTDAGPIQIVAQGAAGAWTLAHAALRGHVDGARIRVVIGGKTYTPDMPHQH